MKNTRKWAKTDQQLCQNNIFMNQSQAKKNIYRIENICILLRNNARRSSVLRQTRHSEIKKTCIDKENN